MINEIPIKRDRFIVKLEEKVTKEMPVRFLIFYDKKPDEIKKFLGPLINEYNKENYLESIESKTTELIDIDRDEGFTPNYTSAQILFIYPETGKNLEKKLDEFVKNYRTILNKNEVKHDEIRYNLTKNTLYKLGESDSKVIEAES